MEDKKYYLSKEGLKKLEEEYEKLKQYKISKTKIGSPKMLESEDLSLEFVAFQEDLELMETRLADLETILKNVELIKPSKEKDIVALGATVKVKTKTGINEYRILGTLEANPALGTISDESPVGKILLGRKIGDEIVINSGQPTAYKIIDVNYSNC